MPYYVRETELFHHGIMKQKWGKRNGPPYPLKNAERSSAEKGANKESKSSKEKKSSSSGSGGSGSSSSKKSTKSTEKSSSSSESGSKEKKKSKHRTNLEEKYQTEYGMSKSDAEAAAAKRIRAEKVVAAVAGAAIIGTAAFIAYRKYGKKYVGQTIKKGMTFQRVTANPEDVNTRNVVYVANKAKDKTLYKGYYGQQLMAQKGKAYNVGLKATKNMKVPSDNTARKTFKELYNNDTSFKKNVDSELSRLYDNQLLGQGTPAANTLNRMGGKITTSNIEKEGYDMFNVALCDHASDAANSSGSTFYSKLKSMGYNAVEDVNDKKYSGYGAKNPLIVFDTSSLAKETTKEMDALDVMVNVGAAQRQQAGEQVASAYKSMAVKASVPTGIAAGAVYINANSPKKKSA